MSKFISKTEAERHQHHHDLIAERKAAYDALPKSNIGLNRNRRREADKKAWWTFTGHLRGMHAVRGGAPFLGKKWADLEEMHDRLHARQRESEGCTS